MIIEQIRVEDLAPYARNARTHSREQVAQLAHSIAEFGFNNPVLIDAENQIIAGHGRVLAAHKLGLKEVPCIRLGHLSADQKAAFILADNQIGLNSAWNEELLASELKRLSVQEFDLSSIGFSIDDLGKYGIGEMVAAPAPPPEAPKPLSVKDYGGATSMARTGAPIRYWTERGLLIGGQVLDFGSGQEGHAFAKYDIVHQPDPAVLLAQYGTVMCNFVLNVQPVDHLITQIVVLLWHCTRPGGTLLLAEPNNLAVFTRAAAWGPDGDIEVRVKRNRPLSVEAHSRIVERSVR